MAAQSTLEDNDDIKSVNSLESEIITSGSAVMPSPLPLFRRQLTDISENQKLAELWLQNELSKVITVRGLPLRGGDQKCRII